MNEERIIVTEKDGIGTITLNRPDVMNAIDRETIDALRGALDRFAAENRVGALILTGAGDRAFAAGADIAQLKERDAADALTAINSGLFKQVEEHPCPTIAAIRGYALGAGCELAMACDLRVAGRGSKFGQPEVNLGIIAGAGAIERLPRLVGLGRAKELLYTGAIIDADTARDIGLVNRIVDDDQVMAAASELALTILDKDRLAVRLTKLSLNATARSNDQVGLSLDAAAQAVCFDSAEKHRRMGEFLERRRKKKS